MIPVLLMHYRLFWVRLPEKEICIINNYGKNAFVVFNRNNGRSFRFAKKVLYNYTGSYKDEFEKLEKAVADGSATTEQKKRQKYLKALDLLSKDFRQVFTTAKVDYSRACLC